MVSLTLISSTYLVEISTHHPPYGSRSKCGTYFNILHRFSIPKGISVLPGIHRTEFGHTDKLGYLEEGCCGHFSPSPFFTTLVTSMMDDALLPKEFMVFLKLHVY
jgi:hypothetical protein